MLVAAVWRDFRTAQKLVDEHPGCNLYERTRSLRSVLRIFSKSAERFFENLGRFKAETLDDSLFRRNRKSDFEEFEAGFQENLFIFASSAMTLADQSRALSRKVDLPGYSERVESTFRGNPRHKFIQELRNDLIHVTLHKPQYQVTTNFENHESTCRFMLWPDKLSRSGEYHTLARAYIRDHSQGIDLGELIESYRRDVNDFHGWLNAALDSVVGDQITDYLRCVKRIKAVSSRSLWNIIFRQVLLPGKRDPYQYLDQYLTPTELTEVNKLPFRSKEQVDCIISLVDEYEACDSALRDVVYKAFGVKSPQPVVPVDAERIRHN